MKKPNMLRVLVTTVSMAALLLTEQLAQGQDAALGLQPAKEKADGPIVEHLKVESGGIFFKLPGKEWASGGPATVGNAVKALRELYPLDTFAVDPHVAELPLTELVIRAKDLNTDLWALRTACGGGFDLGGLDSLHLLQHNKMTEFNASKREDRRIECFNLTGYLGRVVPPEDLKQKEQTDEAKLKAKDERQRRTDEVIDKLQDIIKSTIADFDGTINTPHFQFYPQAQLLIVTGSQQAIEIAAKVIHALPGEEKAFWGYSYGHGDSSEQPFIQQMQGNFSSGAGQSSAYSILSAPAGTTTDPNASKP
jgi:hypothetical protein